MGFLSTTFATATNKLGRTGLKIQKFSPEIMLFAGIGLTVTGVVKACVDTHTKCDDILKEYKENISRADDTLKLVEENKKSESPVPMQEYTAVDCKKDKRKFGMSMAAKMIRTYALDALMIGGGMFCMTQAFRIEKGRFKGAAALAASTGAELYTLKKRINDQLGYEEARNLIYGGEEVDVDMKQTDEDGEEVVIKKPINVTSDEKIDEMSPYAIWFDQKAGAWENSPTHNLAFLRMTQDHFTDLLNSRGHVFLNEVLDRLGLPRKSYGQLVGWVKGVGDEFVDFGLYSTHRKDTSDFLNGYTNIVLLDFNCAGVIYDKI